MALTQPETKRQEVKEEGKEQEAKIAGRYARLDSTRMSHLIRARECAKLTIPTLMPPAGHGNATKYYTPYQGIGARGVNNISSKLLLALLPPNHPFFKFDVPEKVLKDFGQTKGAVEETLTSIERDILGEINSSNIRLAIFEGLKQLIVAGNVLINFPEGTDNLRVFRMDRYVCRRDVMGNVLELIVKEEVAPSMLDPELRATVGLEDDPESDYKNIAVYTSIEWDEESQVYEVEQEINGVFVPDSYGTYPKDKLPWLALRLIAVDNEDYGRSYVEEYLGDIKSLEGLTKAIVEGSAAIAKMVWLVNPNGTTKKRDLVEADNNAVLTGNAADVTVLQAEKQADFRIALETVKTITDRLGYAFMLNTAVQRPGERVTAEEIRYMARELEDGLGGIYTVLTQELQLPMLNIILNRMAKSKKIPALPKGIVKPTITTGLEAIGRGQDLEKLQMFMTALQQLQATNVVKMDEVIKRMSNAMGVDPNGLVKTQQELQQEQQAAMQAQMIQAAVPNAVTQIGNVATTAMQQESQPTPEGM